VNNNKKIFPLLSLSSMVEYAANHAKGKSFMEQELIFPSPFRAAA
jgi:hypothetical protein